MGNISELPDELIDAIIRRIADRGDRLSMARVSKRFLGVYLSGRSSVIFLDAPICRNLVSQCAYIVKFQSSGPLNDEDLTYLAAACPCLQVLDISISRSSIMVPPYPQHLMIPPNPRYLFQGLIALAAGCRSLRELYVVERLDTGISQIIELLPNLTHFHPGNTMCNDDLEALSSVQPLDHLDLYGSGHVTDVGVQFISGNCLTFLDLSSCAISDTGIQTMAQGSCSNTLKVLKLKKCRLITDRGVLLLGNFCKLELLDLCIFTWKVTDVGCASIAALTNLKKLYLCGLNLTDASLISISANCRLIEEIDISGCTKVTGNGIRAFAGLSFLHTMTIMYSIQFEAEDLYVVLGSCPMMRRFVLDPEHGRSIMVGFEEKDRHYLQLGW